MKRNSHALLCILLLLTLSIQAQTPFVEMDKGTKKIHVQTLGLAPSTTIYEALQLFPELLDRESSQLANYSVSLDDQDVGSAKMTLLMQLTVNDVKCIEIQDNASAAYASNGATGSINIVSADLEKGLSGYALVDASTEAGSRLNTAIGYRTDKLQIRANLSGEYLRNDNARIQELSYDGHPFYTDDYFSRNRSWNEGLKFHLEYTPTTADKITAKFWQSFSSKQCYQEDEEHRFPNLAASGSSFNQRETTTTNRNLTIFAQTKYEHKFKPNHKIDLNINYNYNRKKQLDELFVYREGLDSAFSNQSLLQLPHQFSSDIDYVGTLFQRDKHNMNIKVGVQSAYNTSKSTLIDSTYNTLSPVSDTAYSNSWIMHVSPYMEYNYSYGKIFTMNFGGRYRYEQIAQEKTVHAYNSYMLNLYCTVMPAEGHTIRVGALRNYLSPTFQSVTGHSYTGILLYIFNGSFGEHHLNTETKLQYTSVNKQSSRDIFSVWQAGLSAFWSYRWVSLALAFNLFDNQQYRDELLDYKGYYNIRLTPIFRLPANWQLSATLMYNSAQAMPSYTIGRYFYTAIRAEKQLKQWSLYGELTDLFHYKTTDIYRFDSLGSTAELRNTQYPYNRVFRLGIQYRFP